MGALFLALCSPARAQQALLRAAANLPATPFDGLVPPLLTGTPGTSAGQPDATPAHVTVSLPEAPGEFVPSFSLVQQGAPAVQNPCNGCELDANGNPIPLERQQPHRILGFMPNFRTVSAGSKTHPPGWKYNFTVATHQAFDYSTFIFLGLTSLTAKGLDQHPSLGKGPGGLWAYTWRGFIDKTDGTYLQAWLLASLLHEDTRYYPLGAGHPVAERVLYVIGRQAVAKTYGGHDTPNFAGLGGKALTQAISRTYYPNGADNFSVLASKFGYSVMRDVMFSSIREFYPDIAAHYIKKHRAKVARLSAQDAATTH